MQDTNLLIRIILSVVFGAVVGLESETRTIDQKGEKAAIREERFKIGGVRTYTILALIGAISGIFFLQNLQPIAYIIFLAVILLILAAYILNVISKKAFGMTTEISIIITFLLGFMLTSEIVPLGLTLVILVILTFFLSQKGKISEYVTRIEHRELIDITKFALVAAVILPLLPDSDMTIGHFLVNFGLNQATTLLAKNVLDIVLLNPFRMWLVVVFISGFKLIGYILSKGLGASKGLFLTAFFAGLFSSTSFVVAVADKSKHAKQDETKTFAGAGMISNASSFLDTVFIVGISSLALVRAIVPGLAIMFVVSMAVGFYLLWLAGHYQKAHHHEIEYKYEAFSIVPALKFVGLIVLIRLIIEVVQLAGFDSLVLPLLAISGLIGLDIPLVAISGLVGAGSITLNTGVLAFLATNAINLMAKIGYAYLLGSKQFTKFIALGMVLTALASLILLLWH